MASTQKGRLEASLCENCYEVFFSKKLFEAHCKSCTQLRALSETKAGDVGSSTLSKCSTCKRIFLGAHNLALHARREHSKLTLLKTIVPCGTCKKLFLDSALLEQHRQLHHPQEMAATAKADVVLDSLAGLETSSELGTPGAKDSAPEGGEKASGGPPAAGARSVTPSVEPEQELMPEPEPEHKLLPEPEPEHKLLPEPEPEHELLPEPEQEQELKIEPEQEQDSKWETVPAAGSNSAELGGLGAAAESTEPGVGVVGAVPSLVPPAAGGLLYACGSCNVMFMDKELLLKHLAESHSRPASGKPAVPAAGTKGQLCTCAVCAAQYPTLEQVRQHIEAVHGGADGSREAIRAPPAATSRPDSVWSTRLCLMCSALFRPSVRLRDVFMSLSEWTNHFYGHHQTLEKLASGKRLELRPCHRCGLVFVNDTTRQHHNAIAHGGCDPEQELKQRGAAAPPAGAATSQIAPKALTAKARSRVIVNSLMRASLVVRSSPTVTMDRAAARRAQRRVFAARNSSQRVTNVVFKCSKCGNMFPDDPSFERHAREEHQMGVGRPRPLSPGSLDPALAVDGGDLSVLEQRECADCSKLMESCPRSFALFVNRDVWERHVREVHATARWLCTGERLQLRPCPHCPRLFLHPSTLEAHQAKLHDAMLGKVSAAEVEACTPTATLECSRCTQLVQNADGIRFLEAGAWHKHFHGEHKRLLVCDGKAGEWRLFRCAKCQRLFFNERDLPVHEARQAYMHMPLPANAKVKTVKRGSKGAQEETEILFQCANDGCGFTSKEHAEMVQHFQQCREEQPTQPGETVLYKTLLIKKAPRRRHRVAQACAKREHVNRRLENVMKKLSSGGGDGVSEVDDAVSSLLQTELAAGGQPAVLELDPVTSQPRAVRPAALAATDVPEAAAEEETGGEEAPAADADPGLHATRMDFACSVCSVRGASRQEIALHIRRDHQPDAVSAALPRRMGDKERQHQVRYYKSAYLCNGCKRMAEPCARTRDLFFDKATWLHHLSDTHDPVNFSELDRLDLHECSECERLFLSAASLKRHGKFYHEEGADQLDCRSVKQRSLGERNAKYKFSCVEEGCDFKYHRITRLRTHLIRAHNFDLAVREVTFPTEQEFQEWKKTLELTTNAFYIMRSNVQAKRKTGVFNVRYFGCSRVMAHLPSYKENGKKRSLPWQVDLLKNDMVWRCPAFLKAEVAVGDLAAPGIHVTFCPNHYGHDMDPSFARLSDQDEAEIGGMLRAGMSILDVLKRMREEGRQQEEPSRKQRVTEAEINRIFEKYMGVKPPKAKRFEAGAGKAAGRTRTAATATETTAANWNADLVASDGGGEEASLDGGEPEHELERSVAGGGARDSWQRVCGEDDCGFTTNSVGYLRYHLRGRHGFAMHIDSAGFASMKEFIRWKRNLEKRTCARYTCYKSVAPADADDPMDTRYYTCHRSGLNALKRCSAEAPPPRRLVLCTGYMKVRCDRNTGEVACEYCASHYGHDARLVPGRAPLEFEPEYEPVEEEEVSSPPAGRRFSFVRRSPSPSLERRGRRKRPAAPRRSRGGKRRRWEEVEEEEEEEEEQQEDELGFESD